MHHASESVLIRLNWSLALVGAACTPLVPVDPQSIVPLSGEDGGPADGGTTSDAAYSHSPAVEADAASNDSDGGEVPPTVTLPFGPHAPAAMIVLSLNGRLSRDPCEDFPVRFARVTALDREGRPIRSVRHSLCTNASFVYLPWQVAFSRAQLAAGPFEVRVEALNEESVAIAPTWAIPAEAPSEAEAPALVSVDLDFLASSALPDADGPVAPALEMTFSVNGVVDRSVCEAASVDHFEAHVVALGSSGEASTLHLPCEPPTPAVADDPIYIALARDYLEHRGSERFEVRASVHGESSEPLQAPTVRRFTLPSAGRTAMHFDFSLP